MTKERRLAIEMWQDMRELVSRGKINSIPDMEFAKRDWLKEHNIYWYCDCWFCHYFRKDIEDEEEDEGDLRADKTPDCPLNQDKHSQCLGNCKQYSIACKPKYTMEQRIAAVDNIIKALKGEYKAYLSAYFFCLHESKSNLEEVGK